MAPAEERRKSQPVMFSRFLFEDSFETVTGILSFVRKDLSCSYLQRPKLYRLLRPELNN